MCGAISAGDILRHQSLNQLGHGHVIVLRVRPGIEPCMVEPEQLTGFQGTDAGVRRTGARVVYTEALCLPNVTPHDALHLIGGTGDREAYDDVTDSPGGRE
jgi:hypothetical protein